LSAIQGLNLALLIGADYNAVLGRVQIQPDHVNQFLGKVGIITEFERAPQMRLQAGRTPDAIHHATAATQRFA